MILTEKWEPQLGRYVVESSLLASALMQEVKLCMDFMDY